MTDTTSWWFSRYEEVGPVRGRAVMARWSLAAGSLQSYSPGLMSFDRICTCLDLCFLIFEPSVNPYEEVMRQLLTRRTVGAKALLGLCFIYTSRYKVSVTEGGAGSQAGIWKLEPQKNAITGCLLRVCPGAFLCSSELLPGICRHT